MTGKTHLLGGICSAALLQSFGFELNSTMVCAALLGSLLPDIDHFDSKIANENIVTKGIAAFVSATFGHRGFIHTPTFLLIAGMIVELLSGEVPWLNGLAIPLCAGMLSHLILDTLNPGGIMWLWPISVKRYHIAKIKTRSFAESIFAMGMFVIVIGFLFFNRDLIASSQLMSYIER